MIRSDVDAESSDVVFKMRRFCKSVNTYLHILFINWIMISIFTCKLAHINASNSFHHLVVYNPSFKMDLHQFENFSNSKLTNEGEQSPSIKPVLMSQSTGLWKDSISSAYSMDQKSKALDHLTFYSLQPTREKLTIESDESFQHLDYNSNEPKDYQSNHQQTDQIEEQTIDQLDEQSNDETTQQQSEQQDDQQSDQSGEQRMNSNIQMKVQQTDQPAIMIQTNEESINNRPVDSEINNQMIVANVIAQYKNKHFKEGESGARRSLMSKLKASLSENLSAKLRAKLDKNFNLKIKKFQIDRNSTAFKRLENSKKQSKLTLKQIGIRLGKLIKFNSDDSNEILFDEASTLHNTHSINHSNDLKSSIIFETNSDQHSTSSPAYQKLNKDTYKDQTNASKLKSIDRTYDEFDEINRLARFVERNLRIIGLKPVEQLFNLTGNKSSNVRESLRNFRILIRELNSQLMKNRELDLLVRPTDESSSVKDDDEDDEEQFENSMQTKVDKRSDEDDELSDMELIREFESYVKGKMRKAKNEENIRARKRKNKLIKSRKRRSRRMRQRKTNRPHNSLRQRVRSRDYDRRYRMSGRSRKSKTIKKSKYNGKCDWSRGGERCAEESEIHEHYVPFSANDQQISDSNSHLTDQEKSNDDRNSYNEQQSNYDYQQQDSSEDQSNDQSNYRSNDYQSNHGQTLYDEPSSNYDSSNRQRINDYNNEYNNQQDQQTVDRPDENNSNRQLKSNVKYDTSSSEQYDNGGQVNYDHDEYRDGDNQMFLDDSGDLIDYQHPSDYTSYDKHHISDYEETGLIEHPLHTIKKIKLKHLKHLLEHHSPEHHSPEHHSPEHHLSEHHSSEYHAPEHHLSEHHLQENHSSAHHSTGHHKKDDLTLVKELITNLLIQNKHKIFAILKVTKLAHLVASKQFIAVALQIFLGKSVHIKKKFVLAAYKKCYIKIRTIDMLLIPVGVGTLLTPLFLPLAPLALIIFGFIKLFTCFLCFLLAI